MKLPHRVLSLMLSICMLAGIAQAQANPQVKIITNHGEIVVELYPNKAPKTVENFLRYVDSGFYTDTVFHRVMENFMIQGGGFTREYAHKDTQAAIPNEADNGLKNDRGTIAMARTPDPHSATAQFFINVQNNPKLNHTSKDVHGWGYCVFGKVVKGMDVVDTIRKTPTSARGPFESDVPVQMVVIKSVVRLNAAPASTNKKGK